MTILWISLRRKFPPPTYNYFNLYISFIIHFTFLYFKKTYRHISSLKMISYFSSETVTVSPTVSGSLPPSTRTVKSCNEGCVLVIFLLFKSTNVIEKCFIEGHGSRGEFHETIVVGSTDTLGSHSTWNRKLRVHIQLKSQNWEWTRGRVGIYKLKALPRGMYFLHQSCTS